MARRTSSKSFMDYFPYIIGILVIVLVAVIAIGPTGKTREAIDKVEGRDLSLAEIFAKMNNFHGDYLKYKDKADEGESGARAKADKYYRRWQKYKDLWEEEAAKNPKEKKDLEEKWARRKEREKYYAQQELPSDDPVERNRRLIEKKYKDIKELDATAGTGTLNCPDVPVWSDSSKTQAAGKFSHREWVKVLERSDQGGTVMYKVQRRSDKREGWVEGKYVKDIYTQEKLDNLKLKDDAKDDGDDE